MWCVQHDSSSSTSSSQSTDKVHFDNTKLKSPDESIPPNLPSPYASNKNDSKSFLSILERELVHPTTFTQTFLQSILSSIDSKDPLVANAWLETLLDVIDLLPTQVIKNEILGIAIKKGQICQPLSSRISCCKLIGKISSKFEPYLIQQELLPLVLSLCQDVHCEVRANICSQLPCLARGLGPDLTRNSLLPFLVELASDEEIPVRLSAVQSVSDILALLDNESRQLIIVPLVKKLCDNSLKTQDAVLVAISKQLGYLTYNLADNMRYEDLRWFIHYYTKLSNLGAPKLEVSPMPDIVPILDRHELYLEIRYLCAFNLPGMMLIGNRMESQMLRSVFIELSKDVSYNVRQTIASSIHEVSRMLAADGHGNLVRTQITQLLYDNSEEVLENLVPHIGSSLDYIASSLKSIEDGGVLDLCRALLHCEMQLFQTNNWRLQVKMLEQLAYISKFINLDLLFNHFVPRMFLRMHKARPLPCRIEAAKTLLVYLKHLKDDKQVSIVLNRLDTEFLNADCCYRRMLYLRMIPHAITILNPDFFKKYLFYNVLKLTDDKVANIQLELVSLFSPMRDVLRSPTDSVLLRKLESTVYYMSVSERDRDVKNALLKIRKEIDFNPVSASAQENQDKKPIINLRGDVFRRSMHRNSGVMRPVSRSLTPESSKSCRLYLDSKPLKLNDCNKSTKHQKSYQESKIPVTKAIATSPPSIRKITRCMSASNSMMKFQRDCFQCYNKSEKFKLERAHTTLAISPNNTKMHSSTYKPYKSNYFIMDFSSIDPEEFYIDTGIKITSVASSSKIPQKKVDIESIRHRLESTNINNNNNHQVKMREQKIERHTNARRSLPPQDRMTRRPTRPQSCVISDSSRKQTKTSSRSLSEENLQNVSKIPKSTNAYKKSSGSSVSSNKSRPGPSYTAPSSRGTSPEGFRWKGSSPLPPSRLPIMSTRYH